MCRRICHAQEAVRSYGRRPPRARAAPSGGPSLAALGMVRTDELICAQVALQSLKKL